MTFGIRRSISGVAGRVGVEPVAAHTLEEVPVLLYIGSEGVGVCLGVRGATWNTPHMQRCIPALAAIAYEAVLALASVLGRGVT